MSSLQRRTTDYAPAFTRLDRMFDEWFRALPMWRGTEVPGDEVIRVDEFRDGDTQVIRAEMPGIDPDRDVQLTVDHGVLRIAAQRRVEETSEDKGYTRHELRYGSFGRTLPLPEGAAESDIAASYKDGILEIRIPVREPSAPEPTSIPVSRG